MTQPDAYDETQAELERAVLGAILVQPDRAIAARDLLTTADFTAQPRERLWQALARVEPRAIRLTTVIQALARHGWHDEWTYAQLAALTDAGRIVGSYDAALDDLRDRGEKRALRAYLLDAVAGLPGAPSAQDATQAAIAHLSSRATVSTRDATPIADAVGQVIAWLDAPAQGIPVGLHAIDGAGGAFEPGDLVLIAARPSVGKTALALTIARHLAERQRDVVYASLEMSAASLVRRLVAATAGTSMADLAPEQAEARPAAAEALARVAEWPVTVLDRAPTLGSSRRALVRGTAPPVVIVDYLQLLPPPRRDQANRNLEVGAIARELKRLAVDFEVVVIALSQLSRGVEARADLRPRLADLRDSGELEQCADRVILLSRGDEGDPADVLRVETAKNRNGPTTEPISLYYDRSTQLIRDRRLTDRVPAQPTAQTVAARVARDW